MCRVIPKVQRVPEIGVIWGTDLAPKCELRVVIWRTQPLVLRERELPGVMPTRNSLCNPLYQIMPTLLFWPIDEHWLSKHEQHKVGAYGVYFVKQKGRLECD